MLPLSIALSVLLLACGDDSQDNTRPLGAELVAAGQAIYSGANGGEGCAGCHGTDAAGIVGASSASIRNALEHRAMSSLDLTAEQIEALAAYLQSLAE